MSHVLHEGDCLDVLPTLPEASLDSCVTDPPYGLGFMGKEWDCFATEATAARVKRKSRKGTPTPGGVRPGGDFASSGVEYDPSLAGHRRFGGWCREWAALVLRVLKPGAYFACFGAPRTYHRLACAVEDAGFAVRDCLMWLYGSGFPKGKACLKPAYEPILLAMKPAERVQPLNVDECRIPAAPWSKSDGEAGAGFKTGKFCGSMGRGEPTQQNGERAGSEGGRWPANVLHDGSDEVLEAFAAFGDREVNRPSARPTRYDGANAIYGRNSGERRIQDYADVGTAARFFYCAKATRAERGEGNGHPTVKPLALVQWLVRLITPPGGVCLDPFAGSGTTGVAALSLGRDSVLIERVPAYCNVIRRRLADTQGPLFAGLEGTS